MGTPTIFLCLLYFCGALGLSTSPASRPLHCYACSFAKPCNPVPTECQHDEACGVSTGTSEQGESIERRGCLPKYQCALRGHVTYGLHSYTLQHHCCEQDLCNMATALRGLPGPLLLTIPLVLTASFV